MCLLFVFWINFWIEISFIKGYSYISKFFDCWREIVRLKLIFINYVGIDIIVVEFKIYWFNWFLLNIMKYVLCLLNLIDEIGKEICL